MDRKDQEILDNFKGMTVGQIFIAARGAQKLDVSQIAAHLNISTPHLDAIERDDKDALPPKVYAVGFVRAYADVLGLDSEKMAYLFKLQSYGTRKTEKQKDKSTNAQNRFEKKVAIVSDNLGAWLIFLVGLAVVATIIGTLVWLLWPRDSSEGLSIPPAPIEVVNPLDNQSDFSDTLDDAPAEEPMDLLVKPEGGAKAYGGDPLTSALVFKAVEKTWIEIIPVTGSDEALLSRTLKAGDVFYTPQDTDILLTTGNASGVTVYLDGQKLGPLGKKAEIVRLRPFSVKALRLQLQQ